MKSSCADQGNGNNVLAHPIRRKRQHKATNKTAKTTTKTISGQLLDQARTPVDVPDVQDGQGHYRLWSGNLRESPTAEKVKHPGDGRTHTTRPHERQLTTSGAGPRRPEARRSDSSSSQSLPRSQRSAVVRATAITRDLGPKDSALTALDRGHPASRNKGLCRAWSILNQTLSGWGHIAGSGQLVRCTRFGVRRIPWSALYCVRAPGFRSCAGGNYGAVGRSLKYDIFLFC